MTLDELTGFMDTVIQEDRQEPMSFKPVVAIGHTKDLVDLDTIESFLSYLRENRITVLTFSDVYRRCKLLGG
jgi:hypothetical protein